MTIIKKLGLGFAVSLLAVNMSFAAPVECDSTCSFVSPLTPVGRFTTNISFNVRQSGSTSDTPTYLTPDMTRLKGIIPDSGMPMIHLNVIDPLPTGVGKPGTGVDYTVHISIPFSGATPAFTNLFILPASAAVGQPVYVSSWSVTPGNPTLINITLDRPDTLDLMFGKFPSTVVAGQITVGNLTPFDFSEPPTKVALSITGSGFRTANPFILVTPVPAGGMAPKPVFSTAYPLKSAYASLGIHALGSGLKDARLSSYYQRMANVDTSLKFSTLDTSERKPFALNVSDTSLVAAAMSGDTDLVPTAPNGFSVTLPVQITPAGWKAFGQATRGVEMVLTVFDGGIINRSKAFLPGKFGEADFAPGDNPPYFPTGEWNLFCYPWSEVTGGTIGRLVGDTSGPSSDYKIMVYTGAASNNGYVDLTTLTNFSQYLPTGQGFWSGRRDHIQLNPRTAGGTSVDSQTFTLHLIANQWNDFGNPFNIPVKLKDILDSSDTLGSGRSIYHFIPGGDNSTGGGWVSLTSDSVLLPWGGYTVKPSGAVAFRIPVRDTSRSLATASAKTAANSTVWQVDLLLEDATAMSELQLAKGSSASIVDEGPSVPGQDFHAVFLSGNQRVSAIQENLAQGMEGHWPLAVTPEPGFSGLNLRLTGQTGGMVVPLFLVETLHGTSVPLGDSSVRLTAQDLQQGDYHVVAGSPAYVQSFLKSVTSPNQLKLVNFPNPFLNGGTSIRFSLPTTLSQVSYQVRIYDFQGRTVWTKSLQGGPVLDTYWDGTDLTGRKVPTGQYHLSVTAQVPGMSAFHAEHNMIKLR